MENKNKLVELFNDALEIRVNELSKNPTYARVLSEDYISENVELPNGMSASEFLKTWQYENISGVPSLGYNVDGSLLTVESILENGSYEMIRSLFAKLPDGSVMGIARSMDFNKDGKVDAADKEIIDEAISEGSTDKKFDVNNDNKVDDKDSQKVSSKIEAVTEPATKPDEQEEPVEVVATFEYIHDEDSWNASYNTGLLKKYYQVSDAASPYKEDLWNTVELRSANWNDIEKDANQEPIAYEDGYHYTNCERSWMGAIHAPVEEADKPSRYPWAAVSVPAGFEGKIAVSYDGGDAVYPWGTEDRVFNNGYGIMSIPAEFGVNEWRIPQDDAAREAFTTTFDESKLHVVLVPKK